MPNASVEDPSTLPEIAEIETNAISDTTENGAYSQTNYREKKRLLWHGKTCTSLHILDYTFS